MPTLPVLLAPDATVDLPASANEGSRLDRREVTRRSGVADCIPYESLVIEGTRTLPGLMTETYVRAHPNKIEECTLSLEQPGSGTAPRLAPLARPTFSPKPRT